VRDAYEQWCEESRLEPIVELVRSSGSEQAATRLLSRPDRPDAVYALTEAYGPAVLAAAGLLGLQAPGDVLVACGVDSAQALTAEVPLTAIALAPERQARAAVDLLLDRIEGRPGGPVVVEPELIIRASSLRRGDLRGS
jgi:DNA-binding LacI/PurR family transcriptional regulator